MAGSRFTTLASRKESCPGIGSGCSEEWDPNLLVLKGRIRINNEVESGSTSIVSRKESLRRVQGMNPGVLDGEIQIKSMQYFLDTDLAILKGRIQIPIYCFKVGEHTESLVLHIEAWD